MSVTQVYKNVSLSLGDLTEIEFALMERIVRLKSFVEEAEAGHPAFVLLDRTRAALEKVRAEL